MTVTAPAADSVQQRDTAKHWFAGTFAVGRMSVPTAAAADAVVDTLFDDGDVAAALAAFDVPFDDEYVLDVARACVFAATADWDGSVPKPLEQPRTPKRNPDLALERIVLLHEPHEVSRPDLTYTVCSYEGVTWPCETRQLLEEEGIVAATPAPPLDPEPWAWGSVRSHNGPLRDGPTHWSHFQPRPGYEQNPNRYPLPLPTKAIAIAVWDHHDHIIRD